MMRRLWLLSLVLMAAVCAAEEKAPIQCYISRNSGLGGIRTCPANEYCMVQVGTGDKKGHIITRDCRSQKDAKDLPECGSIPWTHSGEFCRCSTSLCNKMMGVDFKCYVGAEGDCDFINSIKGTVTDNHVDVSLTPPVETTIGDTRAYKNDTSNLRCFKHTFSAQGKTCTAYMGEDISTGWVQQKDGSYSLDLGYSASGGKENDFFTYTKTNCTGSLCNKPAKTCGVGGLTLSFVGLMAAVVAAYST